MLRLSSVLPVLLLTVILPSIAGDDPEPLAESYQASGAPGGSVITSVPAVSFDDAGLTFEERVRCQRRIEEVYGSHRTWPAENAGAKPPLDELLPDAVIRERVEAYLGKSAALEVFWSRPLTGEQLQAEMERMVRDTKNPDVLRELFAALDDDPFLTAECLARPALVDRLARSRYARDPRFHSSIRQQAEEALEAFPGDVVWMPNLGGAYNETEWQRVAEGSAASERDPEPGVIELTAEQWGERIGVCP